MLFATLIELKTLLEMDLTKTTTDKDTSLTLLLTGMAARFQTVCNRKFLKEERVEYFNGGKKFYFLSAVPLVLPTVITPASGAPTILDPITFESYGQNLILDTDYYIWEDQGKIEVAYEIATSWPKCVKITYTGGYDEENGVVLVPEDLKTAYLQQCSHEWLRRKNMMGESITMPDGSINLRQGMVTALLPQVQSVIDCYRLFPGDI